MTFLSSSKKKLERSSRSPIIIQNSSNPSSRKKLDVRPYNRTSPVVSALGSESDDTGSSPGRGNALCPWDVREKKMRAPLLDLVKSIYYDLAASYPALA